MIDELKKEVEKSANPKQAEISQRFFKTGKGGYGEGDIFLGLTSQQIKDIAKKYSELCLDEIQRLLKSNIHEERVCALRILTDKYKKGFPKTGISNKKIFDFYLDNTEHINNWDLVDLSAPNIVGDFLSDKKRNILYTLADSESLWERRISIVSTFSFIRNKEFEDALTIAEILLKDKHDLIHKAVGWMLREIGKRDEEILESFLKKHYKNMPRTMLRYSIEKFEEGKRKAFLRGEI